MSLDPSRPDEVRSAVQERYAAAARLSLTPTTEHNGCCSPVGGSCDPITRDLYDPTDSPPEGALAASLGCGNPTALAELRPGEDVLDLGSGGGLDVLLSARRVAPGGTAYGLDMTAEMLDLARRNQVEAGVENARFLRGTIEQIPMADESVDVIISNCVINLAADKAPVLREAYRVLKPGGRFAVSDVVTFGTLPDDLRRDMEAWVGCVAGALEEPEYRRLLADAGFANIEIQVTREYDPRELSASMREHAGSCCVPLGDDVPEAWDESAYARFEASGGKVVSAFVRARKPEVA